MNDQVAALTRRDLLRMLAILFPATLIKCRSDDVFDEERVCVHVYNHSIAIPEPLLHRYKQMPSRRNPGRLFHIGMPELIVCTTPADLCSSFKHFWPLTREEVDLVRGRIAVQFQQGEVVGQDDIEKFRRYV